MLKHLRQSEDFGQKNLLQKGFTLVELLVVIVILGILAAVVVFAVGGSTSDAKKSACDAERATVESAVEAYRAKTGNNPTTLAAMQAEPTDYLRRDPTYFKLDAANDGTLALTAKGTTAGCTVDPS